MRKDTTRRFRSLKKVHDRGIGHAPVRRGAMPPIVGLCAAAGSMQVLSRFFAALPQSPGAAFVVLLHRAQAVPGDVAAQLAPCTSMPVVPVEPAAPLHHDHVYLIAADRQAGIADRQIAALPPDPAAGPHHPADRFLHMLAAARDDALAVILAGAAAGSGAGLAALRQAGGIVLLQHPREIGNSLLPTDMHATAAADFVLPSHALAGQVAALLDAGTRLAAATAGDRGAGEVRGILAHLGARTGHDPAGLPPAAALARIARRARIHRAATLAAYLARLRRDAAETQALLRDLLPATTPEFSAPGETASPDHEERQSAGEAPDCGAGAVQSANAGLRAANRELRHRLDAVAHAHADLQVLMPAGHAGTLFVDDAWRITRLSDRMDAPPGQPRPEDDPRVADIAAALSTGDIAALARTVRRGREPVEREIEAGAGRRYRIRMRPARTPDGGRPGLIVTFVEIGAPHRIETALRESEARLRQEMRLVELSRAPIFVWEFDDRIIQWNRGSEALYGYSRAEAIGRRKQALLRTVVPGSSFAALRRELANRERWSGELIHFAKDGREIIVESQIELVSIDGRQVALESTSDITDRRRWEERQALLLGELTHRIKNTLAVVQSLARLSLRGAASPAAFVEGFEGRLTALASAHTLLVDSRWQGAELGALVRTQLEAYQDVAGRRVRLEGAPVLLSPELATPFGLIIHELATNAAKYGAWASPHGQVRLSWTTLEQDGLRHLHFVWQERGGPAVTKSGRLGAGSTLITSSLPGATIRQDFRRDGLVCTIDQALDQEGHDGDGA